MRKSETKIGLAITLRIRLFIARLWHKYRHGKNLRRLVKAIPFLIGIAIAYMLGISRDVVLLIFALVLAKNYFDYHYEQLTKRFDFAFENIEKIHLKTCPVRTVYKGGETALMRAACMGYEDVVTDLIKSGADVNAQFEGGDTALMYAAINGRSGTIEILIKAGANVNSKNECNETALMYAAQSGMWFAIYGLNSGGYDAVKNLLREKPAINIKDDDGMTALMHLIFKGYPTAIGRLIKSGKHIYEWTDSGAEPISPAIETLNKTTDELIGELIRAGADINEKDNNGMTGLIYAARDNQIDLIPMLIKHKAVVNAKDNEGYTAFAHAYKNGNYMVLNVLIDAGADPAV